VVGIRRHLWFAVPSRVAKFAIWPNGPRQRNIWYERGDPPPATTFP